MRLSGLTRSGERMAEFPADNQRSLFASIVLVFRLVVVRFLRTNGELSGALVHPARSIKAVQSI
jgi:hypothetical protein